MRLRRREDGSEQVHGIVSAGSDSFANSVRTDLGPTNPHVSSRTSRCGRPIFETTSSARATGGRPPAWNRRRPHHEVPEGCALDPRPDLARIRAGRGHGRLVRRRFEDPHQDRDDPWRACWCQKPATLPRRSSPTTGASRWWIAAGPRSPSTGYPPASISTTVARSATGVWVADRYTLYVAIGIGDVTKRNAARGEVPNPAGLSSALFSSLWRIRFSEEIDDLVDGFALDPATHYGELADGREIRLVNASGARARIRVLADFRDLYPGTPPNPVSASNPFGTPPARGPILPARRRTECARERRW